MYIISFMLLLIVSIKLITFGWKLNLVYNSTLLWIENKLPELLTIDASHQISNLLCGDLETNARNSLEKTYDEYIGFLGFVFLHFFLLLVYAISSILWLLVTAGFPSERACINVPMPWRHRVTKLLSHMYLLVGLRYSFALLRHV